MFIRTIILLFLFTLTEEIFSVPQIRILNNSVYQLSDLQAFQIMSDLNYTFIGKVAVEITTNNGNEIAYLESEPIQVIQGIQVYNNLNFKGTLPASDLTNQFLVINLRLVEVSTGIIISTNTETIKLINNTDTSSVSKKEKKLKLSKYFNVSGNIDLQGQYNSRDDTLFNLPTNFFRADIKNDIEILKVPLNTRFYITTEQIHSSQKLNIYHVGFDVTKFKQNMISSTKEKLDKIVQQKDSSKNNYLLKLLDPELASKNINAYKDNLSSKYETIPGDVASKFKEQLSAIDTLKELFQTYDDASLYKLLGELKELKGTAEDSLKQVASGVMDSTLQKLDSNKLMKLQKLRTLMDKYHLNDPVQVMRLVDKTKNFNIQDLTKLSELKQHLLSGTTDIQNKVSGDLKQLMSKPDFNSILNKDDVLQKIDSKFSILSKKDKILNAIKGFDIGYTTPIVGRNTQSGVAINGYNLDLNYKKFIISSNGGKLLNNIPIRNFSFRSFKQFIFSNSIGYGNKSSNYVLLTHTFGKLNQSDSIAEIKNHIVSLNYHVAIFKKKLQITGEVPFSLAKQSGTMKYGYAPSILVKYAIAKNTKTVALYEYISKDYTTFGTPFILLDYHHADFQLEQTIKEKYVVGVGYLYKKFKDTLSSNSSVVLHTLPVTITARVNKEISLSGVFSANWLFESKSNERTQHNFFYTVNASFNYNKEFKHFGYSTQTAFINSYFYNNNRVISENGSVVLTTNLNTLYKNISCYSLHSFNINKNINTTFTINYTYYNNITQVNKNFIIFTFQYQHSIGKKFTVMLNNTFNRNLQTSFRDNISLSLTYRINRYILLLTRFQYDKFKGLENTEWHNENGYLLNSGIRILY